MLNMLTSKSMLTSKLTRAIAYSRTSKLNPAWHRNYVGGHWDEVGRLQLDFLVANGLQPDHYLLDVGCGSLRGGVHFVRYLEPGHYYGVDRLPALLEAGQAELRRRNLLDKAPVLRISDNFSFPSRAQGFDFALAQSVFTHIPMNPIIECLIKIGEALCDGGAFYATFFENPAGRGDLAPISQGEVTTYFDRDPYHYDVGTFAWMAAGTGLTVDYVGDWNHPRNQKMLKFVKDGGAAEKREEL